MLGRSAEAVAVFLAKTEGLDKTLIGDYLGEREDFNLKVMHAYVDGLDFSELEFDAAIRKFLQVRFRADHQAAFCTAIRITCLQL